MKKILLALALWLIPLAAFAQCNGVFPANTLCGNLTGSPAPPSAFTASGTVAGPGSSVIGHFATWANTTGTLLADFNLYAASNAWSGPNNFTSTFQINGNTITWPATAGTVPFLGTNNVWTGANTFAAGGVGLITAQSLATSAIGFTEPINLGLTASSNGTALTLNLVSSNGSVPSPTNPIIVPFRSPTITTGTTSVVTIATATSLTIPSGATLGTTNSIAFRIWTFLGLNAGTPELVVATCSNTSSIFPCAAWEYTTKTTSTISASATTAGVPFAAAAVSNDSLRIIGFCDFASGLTSAGVYASSCSTLQPFGPGIKKPGDLIQVINPNLLGITSTTFTNSQVSTNVAASITPSSGPNLIKFYAMFSAGSQTAGDGVAAQIFRGTTALSILYKISTPTTIVGGGCISQTIIGYDAPSAITSTTYVVKGENQGAGTGAIPCQTSDGAVEILEEIQG